MADFLTPDIWREFADAVHEWSLGLRQRIVGLPDSERELPGTNLQPCATSQTLGQSLPCSLSQVMKNLKQSKLIEWHNSADYTPHLCKLTHCPNGGSGAV
jgi:hypothetical protein